MQFEKFSLLNAQVHNCAPSQYDWNNIESDVNLNYTHIILNFNSKGEYKQSAKECQFHFAIFVYHNMTISG